MKFTWNKLLFVLIVVIGTALSPDMWAVPLASVVIVWMMFAGLVTGAIRFGKWAHKVEYDENGQIVET